MFRLIIASVVLTAIQGLPTPLVHSEPLTSISHTTSFSSGLQSMSERNASHDIKRVDDNNPPKPQSNPHLDRPTEVISDSKSTNIPGKPLVLSKPVKPTSQVKLETSSQENSNGDQLEPKVEMKPQESKVDQVKESESKSDSISETEVTKPIKPKSNKLVRQKRRSLSRRRVSRRNVAKRRSQLRRRSRRALRHHRRSYNRRSQSRRSNLKRRSSRSPRSSRPYRAHRRSLRRRARDCGCQY